MRATGIMQIPPGREVSPNTLGKMGGQAAWTEGLSTTRVGRCNHYPSQWAWLLKATGSPLD